MLKRILSVFRHKRVEWLDEPKFCEAKICGQSATKRLKIETSRFEGGDSVVSSGAFAYACDDPTHAEELKTLLRGRLVDSWPIRTRSPREESGNT